MVYLELLWSFFQVGLMSFGGGLAAMPLIRYQAVDVHGWLSMTEFTDLITISEMTPGPIAINAATFVGTRVAGLGGALAATLGNILPSCVIVLLLAWLYGKYRDLPAIRGALAGLRPAVVALILSAGLSILVLTLWGGLGFSPSLSALDPVAVGLFAAGLFILRRFRPSPMLVMLGCGVIGGACYLLL